MKCLWFAAFVFLVTGCNGVPTPIVSGHLATAGEDHKQRLRAAAEDPPRVIPVTPLEMESWDEHYDAMDEAVEVSR